MLEKLWENHAKKIIQNHMDFSYTTVRQIRLSLAKIKKKQKADMWQCFGESGKKYCINSISINADHKLLIKEDNLLLVIYLCVFILYLCVFILYLFNVPLNVPISKWRILSLIKQCYSCMLGWGETKQKHSLFQLWNE